ncbi:MAG: NfeD family protein [Proteobacteria bacterium]|nr:NfeD family protein [Pseudomonadota bacterium]MBW3616466.1 NfeD family protein [Pseudomonadota bacterium]
MDWLVELYRAQPAWIWLGVAALILTAEVTTGSGWLLWAAVSAAAVAYLAFLNLDIGLPGEVAAFAALTVAATFAGRRFLAPSPARGDLNNNVERLIGQSGRATSPFTGGYGRVAVDGCEWAAELEDGGDLPEGARIEVARLADGARLVVRSLALPGPRSPEGVETPA